MKLLRALLWILPGEFRREYGDQLLRTARDQWEGLPPDLGATGRGRFWARQVWAVIRAAVVLRRRGTGGAASGQPAGHGRRLDRDGGKEDLMDGLRSDLKQGVRALAARPGYAAVAVLTLSLGVGATTTMFSAVNSVLLRPLPYRSPERVVTLHQVDTRDGGRVEGVSAANVRDLAEASERLGAAAVADPWSHDLMVEGRAVSLRSWAVSEGFFEAIGVTAHLGRVFTPDEYRPDGESVVLMSYATWQSRFGGDPEIVGGTIVLDDAPRTVVGVLPPGFEFPGPAELWSPRSPQPYDASHRVSSHMQGVARLAPGATLAQARAEAERVAASLAEEYPETNRNVSMRLVPLREDLVGDVELPLYILFGAVILVLAIASANVAGLQLARGAGRTREYALRGALGASGRRLLRLVSVESLLMAGAGSTLGIGLAYGGVELIRRLAPDHLPRIDELSMDWRVLLFAVGVGIAAALASGVVPALSASRTDLHLALSEGGRGSTEGRGVHRLRDRLVVGEIALALVLSIGAGLLLRSFERVLTSELGFEPEGRLAVQLFAYDDRGEVREDFLQTSREAVLSVPGVEAVAVTTDLPAADDRTISSIEVNVPFTVVDRVAPPDGQEPIAAISSVTPGYPEVMGMRVIRGRSFTSLDNADSAPVIMINETLARRHFPGRDPVGEALRVDFREVVPRRIVGVLADVRPRGHESAPRPEVYFPLSQVSSGSLTYVVKAGVATGSLVQPVQEAIWSVEPSQAIWAARPLPDLLWDWIKERSFNTALLTAFALLALALAAIGIYGLMSFTVEQRVGELGIRRAMGADSADVLRSMLGRGAGLAAVGVGLGLAGSVALSLFLRGMLFAVEPLDPVTYVALPAVVLGVTLLASFIPAHRATRVDPVTALRAE